MTTQFLSFMILFFSLACNFDGKEKQSKIAVAALDSVDLEIKGTANIRFDFTTTRSKMDRNIIEVVGQLYNEKTDTVYFLTYTCNGDQYFLHYDTSKFDLTPFMLCNALFPKIQYIAPKSQYDFPVHLRIIKNETTIKLGFEFCQVDKSFNLSTENINKIRSLSKENQLVIWANEKVIQ